MFEKKLMKERVGREVKSKEDLIFIRLKKRGLISYH